MREATLKEVEENVTDDVKTILEKYYNFPPNELIMEITNYVLFNMEES